MLSLVVVVVIEVEVVKDDWLIDIGRLLVEVVVVVVMMEVALVVLAI